MKEIFVGPYPLAVTPASDRSTVWVLSASPLT